MPGLQRVLSRVEEAEVVRSCGKDRRILLPGLGACLGNRSAWGGLGRLHTGALLEGFLSTERAGLLEAFLYGRCLRGQHSHTTKSGLYICHLSRVVLQLHPASEKLGRRVSDCLMPPNEVK